VIPAPQKPHLVVDPTAAAPPAALQVEPPAGRDDASDSPALGADYVGQQVARVGPVVFRDVGHQVVEEADLVTRAGPAFAPDPGVAEVAHPGDAREPLDPPPADEVADLGRRDAVGAADHRPEQLPVARREPAPVAHPQERGEQHHLEDARRRRRARRVVPVVAAALVDHREGDLPLAMAGVAARRRHVRAPGTGARRRAGTRRRGAARAGDSRARRQAGEREQADRQSAADHQHMMINLRRGASTSAARTGRR